MSISSTAFLAALTSSTVSTPSCSTCSSQTPTAAPYSSSKSKFPRKLESSSIPEGFVTEFVQGNWKQIALPDVWIIVLFCFCFCLFLFCFCFCFCFCFFFNFILFYLFYFVLLFYKFFCFLCDVIPYEYLQMHKRQTSSSGTLVQDVYNAGNGLQVATYGDDITFVAWVGYHIIYYFTLFCEL
jgi:hypothetical protein